MATYQVKLTPKSTHLFGSEHFMVGTAMKKVVVAYPSGDKPSDVYNRLLETIEATVRSVALDIFKVNVDDKDQEVRGFKKRLELATWAWKTTPSGEIPPGRHKLQVHIVEAKDIDDDGRSMVEINLEIQAPPDEVEKYTFTGLVQARKVTMTRSVGKMIGNEEKAKIISIYTEGSGYSGHGATTALGARVCHTHVTNRTALGFRWDDDVLTIVGWGEKSDSAGSGTSGYDWTT